MNKAVKSDPRNIGKTVRMSLKRGPKRFERTGTIAWFRGGRNATAAFVTWRTPSGMIETASFTLKSLEYV